MIQESPEDFKLFMFLGDRVLTIQDLDAAADMPLTEGLQSILDQGLMGDEFKGIPWHLVFNSQVLRKDCEPSADHTLQHSLWRAFNAKLEECQDLNTRGLLRAHHRTELIKLRGRWKTSEKLAKP